MGFFTEPYRTALSAAIPVGQRIVLRTHGSSDTVIACGTEVSLPLAAFRADVVITASALGIHGAAVLAATAVRAVKTGYACRAFFTVRTEIHTVGADLAAVRTDGYAVSAVAAELTHSINASGAFAAAGAADSAAVLAEITVRTELRAFLTVISALLADLPGAALAASAASALPGADRTLAAVRAEPGAVVTASAVRTEIRTAFADAVTFRTKCGTV